MAEAHEEVQQAITELLVSQTDETPSTFASSLSESLVNAQTDNMLEFLSKKKDLRIINQQRDEPELSSEQRLDMLKSIFMENPMSFLNRFGKHLEKTHLDCFSSLPGLEKEKNVEVTMYVKALEKAMMAVSQETIAKNRRYEALQRLVDTTDYFTEPEMQRRNPILFEQLIGRYHSKEEREAFLQLLQKCSDKLCTPLTDMLIAHMNRSDDNVSERRLMQEHQIDEENAADEEYFEDEDMDEDDYDYGPSASGRKPKEEEETVEIDDEEKDLLKEEFFTTMYRNFLEGKDEDFDYTTVDSNEEYDCGEVLNQDAEDKYFDAEDSLSCHSSNNFEGDGDCDMRSSPTLNPHGTHNEEESEDELDIYMKTLEKQLQTRN